MISEWIKRGEAYYDNYNRKLQITHSKSTINITDLSPLQTQIKTLCLNHCQLSSLSGIQSFTQLQQLVIKYNNIYQIQELYRIQCKEKIVRLDFVGNDIQFLGAGMFISLVKVFPNLVELNGRNYFDLIHKNSNKIHSMKRIVAQSHKLHKQMMKTKKKDQIRQKLAQHNYYNSFQPQHYTSTTTNRCQYIDNQRIRADQEIIHTDNRQPSQHYEEYSQQLSDEEYDENRDCNIESTSKKQTNNLYKNDKILREVSMNQSNIKMTQNDISLGAISNIPMTKSVRGSIVKQVRGSIANISNSQIHAGKQIKKMDLVLNMNDPMNRMQVAPTTATFAAQQEKQNYQPILGGNGFAFKNKEKTQKYKNLIVPIEESRQKEYYCREQERPTKRETYGSVDNDDYSWSSSMMDENNPLQMQKRNNQIQKCAFSQTYYSKCLVQKSFNVLRALKGCNNLPMKRRYL